MGVNVGDEVTLNAIVIAVSESGNPIIKINSGYKFLVKDSDINTVRPRIEIPDTDMRRGN